MDEARWERIERTIEYLTNQQASSDAKFSEWSDRAQARLDELLHVQEGHQVLIDALFASQDRTQRIADQNVIAIRELRESQRESYRELTDSQRHTDERLNALIGFVDRNNR